MECRGIIHSGNSSRCTQFSLLGINTEIFSDGFRDKIFDTEMLLHLDVH